MFIKAGIFLFLIAINSSSCRSQSTVNVSNSMSAAASKFLETLSARQKARTQFLFNEEERYNWHYIPKNRKGILSKARGVSEPEHGRSRQPPGARVFPPGGARAVRRFLGSEVEDLLSQQALAPRDW